MRKLLIAIALLFVCGCSSDGFNKKYICVQTFDGIKSYKNIYDKSDSSAFQQAYNLFLTNKESKIKEYNDIARTQGFHTIKPHTYEFTLLNKDSVDITNIQFAGKDDFIAESERIIIGSLVELKPDSAKIKELDKYFTRKFDEFKEITWIKPKSASRYRSSNDIYCYFMVNENEVPSNFRLVIQYYDDDWLFWGRCKISIDDEVFDFIPSKRPERDHSDGYVFEWSDEGVTHYSDIRLINALSNAKKAKIRFYGSQYYDDRQITQKQLTNIKRVLEYYIAKGGEL